MWDLGCRKDDPAAWIKHQKRGWQKGVQERKKRKLEAAKAAGKPSDPSKAPKGLLPVILWDSHAQQHSCMLAVANIECNARQSHLYRPTRLIIRYHLPYLPFPIYNSTACSRAYDSSFCGRPDCISVHARKRRPRTATDVSRLQQSQSGPTAKLNGSSCCILMEHSCTVRTHRVDGCPMASSMVVDKH